MHAEQKSEESLNLGDVKLDM